MADPQITQPAIPGGSALSGSTLSTSGNASVGGTLTVTGATTLAAVSATSGTFSGKSRNSTSTPLGTTGTVSLDPTLGEVFTCTPTGDITLNAASAAIGTRVTIEITTSGTSSFNITPNTNFKSAGVLATGTVSGKVFTMTFMGDGTKLNEIARTAAM